MDLGRFGLAPSTTRSHPLRPSIVLPTAAASDPFSVYTGHCRSDLAKANRRVMTRHKSTWLCNSIFGRRYALYQQGWEVRMDKFEFIVPVRLVPHPGEPVTESTTSTKPSPFSKIGTAINKVRFTRWR
jgi:hypothetical protein